MHAISSIVSATPLALKTTTLSGQVERSKTTVAQCVTQLAMLCHLFHSRLDKLGRPSLLQEQTEIVVTWVMTYSETAYTSHLGASIFWPLHVHV